MNESGAAFENIWFVGEVIRETLIRGTQRLASKMFDNNSKYFYVTLFSIASQSLYPTNMIGALTVELPQPIELGPNDNWEVGLCEISYPPNTLGKIKSVNVVGDTTALVYCDVISPQYVGKSLVRYLRTFVYPTMYVEHVYDYIYYLPVVKHMIKIHG